ncbi:MAG TPA: hypothetical protein VG944_19550, partial [Fimbriimonas sp.]|nr:hypothetical protein [Fimbriimonas sp.]
KEAVAKLELRYRHLAKVLTARSIVFIATHKRFGRTRPSVLSFWGTKKAHELGSEFFLGLLTSSERPVRSAALDALSRAVMEGVFSEELGRVTRRICSYYKHHAFQDDPAIITILERQHGSEATDVLGSIALGGPGMSRDLALEALYGIGTPDAAAALVKVRATLTKTIRNIDDHLRKAPK